MVSVTLKISPDFKAIIDQLPWVNWSELAREEITKKLEEEHAVQQVRETIIKSLQEKHTEQLKPQTMFKTITKILSRHNAKKIYLFGSYARGEATPQSDIDIIVEFSDRKSLLNLVSIEQELTEAVGKKVDLLTEHSISPYLRQRIKKEQVVLSS